MKPRILLALVFTHCAFAQELPKVDDDLALDLVLDEETIAQPVHLSFDERGRLWVSEMRQYPEPAGLKPGERDEFWRVAYSEIPPPPPHAEGSRFRGAGRISVHTDSDGDGTFEQHAVFADGLSLVTSTAHGHGGVWVTQAPYLLFYPDADGDAVADGAPEVRLEGFGIEDSHATANSLAWGPDGWLYGAQGSTCSMAVKVPGSGAAPVLRKGQCVWRYEPRERRFEVFAEGGGNSYGVEFDAQGRLFSGHNGGDTRGFHYVPGGYYQKNFGKHGGLSNPHAYGHIGAMPSHRVARFVHQFTIYEETALPARFHGKIVGCDILHQNLVLAERIPNGSSFRTKDVARPVRGDKWFSPQHVTPGPDGALYIADWFDDQVNHYRNHEGLMERERGRVFRLRASGTKPGYKIDYASLTDDALAELLDDPARWIRHTARRVIADRKITSPSAPGIDRFWANHAHLVDALGSSDAAIRAWAVRFLAERSEMPPEAIALASADSSIEVAVELACAAPKITAKEALAIVGAIAARKEWKDDPHLPLLLWWALEAHAEAAVPWIIEAPTTVWDHPIDLPGKLIRRMAETENFEACRILFSRNADELYKGFEAAFEGRIATKEALGAIPSGAVLSLTLAIRLGLDRSEEIREKLVQGGNQKELASLLKVIGETKPKNVKPLLTRFLGTKGVPQKDLVRALGCYEGREIAEALLKYYPDAPPAVGTEMTRVLATRREWAALLLDSHPRVSLPSDVKIQIGAFGLPGVSGLPAPAEIENYRRRLSVGGKGDPVNGRDHYKALCASCHQLGDLGRDLGPDLTSYQRTDRDALLLATLTPAAEIREGYELAQLTLTDGSTRTGFLRGETVSAVTLRDLAGTSHTIAKDRIASTTHLEDSAMPAGLLSSLGDQQLRDLFAFLQLAEPARE